MRYLFKKIMYVAGSLLPQSRTYKIEISKEGRWRIFLVQIQAAAEFKTGKVYPMHQPMRPLDLKIL